MDSKVIQSSGQRVIRDFATHMASISVKRRTFFFFIDNHCKALDLFGDFSF